MHRLIVPGEIRQLIRKMHPELKRKVRRSLDMILSEPSSGKPLVDELTGLRSFRVSSFRIITRVRKKEEIELVAVGPRERIYAETFRLLKKEREKKARNEDE